MTDANGRAVAHARPHVHQPEIQPLRVLDLRRSLRSSLVTCAACNCISAHARIPRPWGSPPRQPDTPHPTPYPDFPREAWWLRRGADGSIAIDCRAYVLRLKRPRCQELGHTLEWHSIQCSNIDTGTHTSKRITAILSRNPLAHPHCHGSMAGRRARGRNCPAPPAQSLSYPCHLWATDTVASHVMHRQPCIALPCPRADGLHVDACPTPTSVSKTHACDGYVSVCLVRMPQCKCGMDA